MSDKTYLKFNHFLFTNFPNENMESLQINCQSDLTEKKRYNFYVFSYNKRNSK